MIFFLIGSRITLNFVSPFVPISLPKSFSKFYDLSKLNESLCIHKDAYSKIISKLSIPPYP